MSRSSEDQRLNFFLRFPEDYNKKSRAIGDRASFPIKPGVRFSHFHPVKQWTVSGMIGYISAESVSPGS